MFKCENHYFQIREDYFCGLFDCAKMQIGKKLKVLRNDNGGEFVPKEFENYLKFMGFNIRSLHLIAFNKMG